jgi:hypothetical protein
MFRFMFWFFVSSALLSACSGDRGIDLSGEWTVTRSEKNPAISTKTEGIVPEWEYENVNGPSVIRVPDWVDGPLGRYYMYFAHHRGSFIRFAFADDLNGPWTVKKEGVLDLADTPALDHIASPDVLVDDENQIIRMFYHSVDDTSTWKQTTYMATSTDGLSFHSGDTPIGPPYLRAFRTGEQWWAIAKIRGGPGGVLLRADSPDGPFAEGPVFLPGMRHGTALPTGSGVEIVFSRIGDAPERLLRTSIDVVRMWDEPYQTEITDLLRPEREYEGGHLPVSDSQVGEATGPVNALRDPYLFLDETGETYLFYSIAGENGVAMATIRTSQAE